MSPELPPSPHAQTLLEKDAAQQPENSQQPQPSYATEPKEVSPDEEQRTEKLVGATSFNDEPERPAFQENQRPSGFMGFLGQEVSKSPRARLNTVLATILLSVAIALLGFLPVSIPALDTLFSGGPALMTYVFQLPFCVLLGALLGPGLGAFAVLLYLGAGLLGLPLFANGGTPLYLFEPSFGYLAGFLVGTVISGRLSKKTFLKPLPLSKLASRLSGIAVFSVLAVHLCGTAWLIALSILTGINIETGLYWFTQLTLQPLAYDLLFATVALCLVRPLRMFLWPALY